MALSTMMSLTAYMIFNVVWIGISFPEINVSTALTVIKNSGKVVNAYK